MKHASKRHLFTQTLARGLTLSFVLLVLSLMLLGCGSNRLARTSKSPTAKHVNSRHRDWAPQVIANAKHYLGTRYRLGGTSKKGLDCSGLIYKAFQQEGRMLPRTSKAMSRIGKKIKINTVQKGDLLFFKTNSRKRVINHVGLVVAVNRGTIKFIHATSSKGVLISRLESTYWKRHFNHARRLH